MVLRCSLLGCDYGDAEIEREREERGSEVVVTVQEYEECSRCGDRHVISENTEVTSLSAQTNDDASIPPEPDAEPDLSDEQPGEATTPTHPAVDETDGDPTAASSEDAVAESADTGGQIIDADDGTSGDSDEGVVITDAETDDELESDTDPGPSSVEPDTTPGPSSTEPDTATEHAGDETDPATDDGEILEETADEPHGRDHGEWPDSDDVGQPTDAADDGPAWPDDHPDEEVTDDAVVLEHSEPDHGPASPDDGPEPVDPTTDPAAESGSGSSPASPTDSGSGIERANPAPTPGDTDLGAGDVPTEFYCPRCEFDESNDRGSLRSGDICPDCRKGYLSERPVR